MTTTKITIRWWWTMDTFRFVRLAEFTWAFDSGELAIAYIWLSRLTYTHITYQDRNTDTSINIHRCTQSIDYIKRLITCKFICWVDRSLSSQPGFVLHQSRRDVLFHLKNNTKTSVRIINIVIMKCMISWLITLNTCSDTSPQSSLFSKTNTYL